MDSSTTATISSLKTTISPSPNPNRAKKIPIFPYKKTTLPSFSNFKSVKCIHSPPPNPKPSNSSPFTCTAVTFSPSQTTELVPSKLHHLITEFQSLSQPIDRVKRLLHCATFLSPLPESSRVDSNRVMGCTAQVWLEAQLDQYGKMKFWADSDSEITRGFCYCLIWVLDGATPDEVLKVTTEDLTALNVGLPVGARSRVNTWHNVLVSMQKRARILVAERDGKKDFDPFPSLVISSDGIQAKGSYAEAQARYLFPDESKKHWPHIHISDSLVMADSAVKMAEAGCKFITVLGVDFMSENVRAILDQAGFGEVGVYRMSNERIGCSLAEAASTPAYMNYLGAASGSPPSLHVIYINTSLETKAYAHELVPTITCTSSNVVQTILQAFAQIPDLNVWYGPDSYMGANISKLFQQMTMMSDEEIAEIHPAHNGDSIRSLLPRLHYYQDGTCIVHHLFGHEVVEKINEMYCDAFLTAHLEVPGEMFSLAMEAKRRGMGVVGSTQNILDFIKQRVQEALDRDVNDHLRFVLGTESGMVTSIVAAVRHLLLSTKSSEKAKVNVEIVFPVSSDSITRTSTASTSGLNSVKVGDIILPVIPGAASGEGCSIHGGCASCPYMKMNSLDSLLKVCHHLPDEKNKVAAYEAERFKMQTLNGKSIADVGCEPILHMRHFQATKELPDKLVCQALSLNSNGRSIS
ncbi:QUINOLINATE SYNTHETASE A [Salix purpurea]|uniref:Quinolinate synthase, chloroplastic n=1 Tax=Salix purpurea TaxID=77065 RepID=A0A9Q0V8H5_SALPP|nr:QUINOLINATE SYNTHETASE A [Salix purpurea]